MYCMKKENKIEFNGRNPYSNPKARHIWTRACNFHRGSDKRHVCGNPSACEKRLVEAWAVEMSDQGWS